MANFNRTLFSDDFARVDGNTVGNGWTETEDSADIIRLVGSQLVMGSSASNTAPYIFQGYSPRNNPVEINFTISFTAGAGDRPFYCAPAQFGTGLVSAGDFHLVVFPKSSGTAGSLVLCIGAVGTNNFGSGSVTVGYGTTYNVWLDAIPNGNNWDLNAYLSTSSTKPASATAAGTNIAGSLGTNFGMGWDSNNNCLATIDNFFLYDSNSGYIGKSW